MKIHNRAISLLAGITMLFQVVSTASHQCPQGDRIRYSWYDLPETERQRFITTLRKLHSTSNKYSDCARLHYEQMQQFHNNPMFLPAHRRLLLDFETAMKSIDPQVVLPYWDWARYADKPSADPIWNYFSRDGNGRCVTDDVLESITDPEGNCLSRGIDRAGPPDGTYASYPVLLAEIKREDEFWEWAKNLELSAHNTVHYYVGGTLSTEWSAFDPLFYLHHTFIDYLWDIWQRASPKNSRLNKYGGTVKMVTHRLSDPVSGKWSSALVGIPRWTETVADVMDIEELCYTYHGYNATFIGPFERQNATLPSTTAVHYSTALPQSSSIVHSPSTSRQTQSEHHTTESKQQPSTSTSQTLSPSMTSPKKSTTVPLSSSHVPATSSRSRINVQSSKSSAMPVSSSRARLSSRSSSIRHVETPIYPAPSTIVRASSSRSSSSIRSQSSTRSHTATSSRKVILASSRTSRASSGIPAYPVVTTSQSRSLTYSTSHRSSATSAYPVASSTRKNLSSPTKTASPVTNTKKSTAIPYYSSHVPATSSRSRINVQSSKSSAMPVSSSRARLSSRSSSIRHVETPIYPAPSTIVRASSSRSSSSIRSQSSTRSHTATSSRKVILASSRTSRASSGIPAYPVVTTSQSRSLTYSTSHRSSATSAYPVASSTRKNLSSPTTTTLRITLTESLSSSKKALPTTVSSQHVSSTHSKSFAYSVSSMVFPSRSLTHSVGATSSLSTKESSSLQSSVSRSSSTPLVFRSSRQALPIVVSSLSLDSKPTSRPWITTPAYPVASTTLQTGSASHHLVTQTRSSSAFISVSSQLPHSPPLSGSLATVKASTVHSTSSPLKILPTGISSRSYHASSKTADRESLTLSGSRSSYNSQPQSMSTESLPAPSSSFTIATMATQCSSSAVLSFSYASSAAASSSKYLNVQQTTIISRPSVTTKSSQSVIPAVSRHSRPISSHRSNRHSNSCTESIMHVRPPATTNEVTIALETATRSTPFFELNQPVETGKPRPFIVKPHNSLPSKNNTVSVALGPPLLPIPEEYRRKMGISDADMNEVYRELAEVYNGVNEDIRAGKPLELPGFDNPVKLQVVKGIEFINQTAADNADGEEAKEAKHAPSAGLKFHQSYLTLIVATFLLLIT